MVIDRTPQCEDAMGHTLQTSRIDLHQGFSQQGIVLQPIQNHEPIDIGGNRRIDQFLVLVDIVLHLGDTRDDRGAMLANQIVEKLGRIFIESILDKGLNRNATIQTFS